MPETETEADLTQLRDFARLVRDYREVDRAYERAAMDEAAGLRPRLEACRVQVDRYLRAILGPDESNGGNNG